MQSATRAIKRKAVLFVFVKQAQLSSVCKSGGQEHKAAFKHQKKKKKSWYWTDTGHQLRPGYVRLFAIWQMEVAEHTQGTCKTSASNITIIKTTNHVLPETDKPLSSSLGLTC